MRLTLEFISGEHTGKEVVMEAQQVVRIGRTAKSDLATDDTFMSGEHFIIESEGDTWQIRDLKSRNGTRLNGKKISTAELHEGDKIHAGSTDFIVHIGTYNKPQSTSPKLLTTLPPAVPTGSILLEDPTSEVPEPKKPVKVSTERKKGESTKRPSGKKKPETLTVVMVEPDAAAEPAVAAPLPEPTVSVSSPSHVDSPPLPPFESSQPLPQDVIPPPRVEVVAPTSMYDSLPGPGAGPDSSSALESYEAATPTGRLLRLLQSQPLPLFALVDATHDAKVLQLLQGSGEDFRSLYQDPANSVIAPYLVSLPPRAGFLQEMIKAGWGRGWGVYLTCPFSLTQLREYFRRELMVRLPDGVELFSRFYEPRFFRTFLDTCSAAEAEKFFGPVAAYLMESDKPEIALQFIKTTGGVEKKGHLLSEL